MIKNIVSYEVEKGERIYRIQLAGDSPLGECLDVANEFRNFVLQKIAETHKEPEKEAPKE